MKKDHKTALSAAVFLALALLAQFSPAPAGAYSPAAYPGGTWGNFSRASDGLEGTGSQGWVKQGVTWLSPGGYDLNTYGAYSWRVRTKNKTYYNVYGPGLVAAVEKNPFSLGVQYDWLRYPDRPQNTESASMYAGWYYSLDMAELTGLEIPGRRAPLSTWGKLTYDLHGVEGSGSQGWVKQALDLFLLGRGWKVNTFASYNWRLRSRNKKYYDAIGPSVGLSCFSRRLNAELEYSWQRFPELHRSTKHLNFSLNWYYNWNLKKKK
jgi:hypothetical protein